MTNAFDEEWDDICPNCAHTRKRHNTNGCKESGCKCLMRQQTMPRRLDDGRYKIRGHDDPAKEKGAK